MSSLLVCSRLVYTPKGVIEFFDLQVCDIILKNEECCCHQVRYGQILSTTSCAAWVGFLELCARGADGSALGAPDFLALTNQFPVVFLHSVPQLRPSQRDEARRYGQSNIVLQFRTRRASRFMKHSVLVVVLDELRIEHAELTYCFCVSRNVIKCCSAVSFHGE